MNLNYIIVDGVPKVEEDVKTWAEWNSKIENKIVALDEIGPSVVSTIFLGMDHGYNINGSPVLWETMVFGGPLDQIQERCSGTKEQAEGMHRVMVEKVKESLKSKGIE